MKIFIVYAHPEPKSFCHAMLQMAVARLQQWGHQVIVSDLYLMNFNPVANATDFGKRQNPDYLTYALEQRHNYDPTKNINSLKPDIAAEVEKIFWCDLLLCQFPLYWFSMPAMVKGWFDRVLLSGAMYGGKNFYEGGKLIGRKASLIITAGSKKDFFLNENSMHGEWQTMLRPILRGTLYYVGFSVLPPFTAWHVPYVVDNDRQIMLQQFETYLKNLPTAPALVFPKKSDFGY